MTVEIEKFDPQMIESFERLNLFFHVHRANQEMLDSAIALVESLGNHPGKTLSNEMLSDWLEGLGYACQTVDALMHLLQKKHVGPALAMAKELTDEDKIYIRDNLHTEDLNEMMNILTETSEERTQRMLLEHLHVHD